MKNLIIPSVLLAFRNFALAGVMGACCVGLSHGALTITIDTGIQQISANGEVSGPADGVFVSRGGIGWAGGVTSLSTTLNLIPLLTFDVRGTQPFRQITEWGDEGFNILYDLVDSFASVTLTATNATVDYSGIGDEEIARIESQEDIILTITRGHVPSVGNVEIKVIDSSIPEPSTAMMFTFGSLCILLRRRK
ncbi:PEP-CTERM sorting domain-containing protein [Haloferula sp.]|uniref:PEP-CTERM sorting domain-containing protein n=1 Tax=Haloferula sp. TaxID=2497595 RepID=UPI00329AC718